MSERIYYAGTLESFGVVDAFQHDGTPTTVAKITTLVGHDTWTTPRGHWILTHADGTITTQEDEPVHVLREESLLWCCDYKHALAEPQDGDGPATHRRIVLSNGLTIPADLG